MAELGAASEQSIFTPPKRVINSNLKNFPVRKSQVIKFNDFVIQNYAEVIKFNDFVI